jgi:DMSO reductase anchor subunit
VLFIFSLSTALLTALISQSVVMGQGINKWIFLAVGVAGIVLSSLHLGKKFKAGRSFLNLKTSWLSREVLSYGLFIALSFIWLDTFKLEMGYIAALLGFAACYTIDKVYQVTHKTTKLNIHSASVFLTAMLFTSLFVNNEQLFYIIIILKFLLYAYRKIYFRMHSKKMNLMITGIRILFGFFLPLIIWQTPLNEIPFLLASLLLVGEIIDRIEFYLELEVMSPIKQIEQDTKKYLKYLP